MSESVQVYGVESIAKALRVIAAIAEEQTAYVRLDRTRAADGHVPVDFETREQLIQALEWKRLRGESLDVLTRFCDRLRLTPEAK